MVQRGGQVQGGGMVQRGRFQQHQMAPGERFRPQEKFQPLQAGPAAAAFIRLWTDSTNGRRPFPTPFAAWAGSKISPGWTRSKISAAAKTKVEGKRKRKKNRKRQKSTKRKRKRRRKSNRNRREKQRRQIQQQIPRILVLQKIFLRPPPRRPPALGLRAPPPLQENNRTISNCTNWRCGRGRSGP